MTPLRASFPACLLLSACAAGDTGPSQKAHVLRIGGDPTITERLLPGLVEAHKRLRGTMTFEVKPESTGDAMRGLLTGELDMAAAARRALPAEEDQARANGFDLSDPETRHIVGVNVVTVMVHPQNTVESLTYDQVIGIYCSHQIGNWSYLGEDGAPIRALALPVGTGERDLFEDFFCGPRGLSPKVETQSAADIQKILTEDRNAIAFLSHADSRGKVMALRAFSMSHAVPPSQQNIIRGVYPLAHDLFLYTPGPASQDAQDFLDWIASPAGQDVVDEARFVPLYYRPPLMDDPRPLRETIRFEEHSSDPDQRSTARLGLLIDELRDRAGESRHVILEGFTDDREKDPMMLSQRRAEVVRELLQAELPGVFFEIIPRGTTSPLAPNDTPYGRQANRRVQIYLSDEEKPDLAPAQPEGEPG